jgi:GNAT superfamily N-acetyltransferase
MSDMLVRLYDLPPHADTSPQMRTQGVIIRKPFGPERHTLIEWVRHHFSDHWAAETDNAMSTRPMSCLVAVLDKQFVGFACYDTTFLGMFGPTGVAEEHRGKGIGKSLLLAAMRDMLLKGYAYAVIGMVGPVEFYAKVLGATVIPGSDPGPLETWVRNRAQGG